MMTGVLLQSTAMAAALAVPVAITEGWTDWGFRGIPRHVVTRSAEGLRIAVVRSAGPVVYRLPAPLAVTGLTAIGRIDGDLAVSGPMQGQPQHDDYALRVGLVTKGTRRLGRLQRLFAPEWVRNLYDLVPAGSGLSDVQFFNLGVDGAPRGRERQHPLHELLRVALDAPVETLGIWIGSDGDDTGSTFSLLLTSLTLETATATGAPEPRSRPGPR